MPSFVTSTPFLAVTGVIILILLIAFVASRYKVASANEALIVAGSRGAKVRDEKGKVMSQPGDRGVKVVVGGGTFIRPLLDRVGKLKLTARQINVQLADAVTSQGIKVQVQGVATFKIGRDVESLRNAAERFLDAKPEQVDSIVKNVLEGSLRSIVGTLTIEELIRDRQKLLQQVQDAAKGDLATSGLQIDAFTIQSFSDESNYIELLGQQSVSTVTRDARIMKASTDQEAAVREAQAQQVKINAGRDVSLREAETKTQVAAAQARADQAGPLAQAEAQQEVVRKQTELAQLEADRKEKELLSSTVKPAAAEAQAVIAKAEGDKRSRIAAAEAEAETVRLEGGAEAAIVLTKGEAEAKALAMRADAYSIARHRPGRSRADGPHQLPDRDERRRRLGHRAECDASHDRVDHRDQGPDRSRRPRPDRWRDGPRLRRAVADWRRRKRQRHWKRLGQDQRDSRRGTLYAEGGKS
ncbi:MAG: hypothetical protein E6J37_10810 [Chloroflexi bacterium]|nr:MAG: hypothetical protein E6J37_10810 [Chloroflexota bacterium]